MLNLNAINFNSVFGIGYSNNWCTYCIKMSYHKLSWKGDHLRDFFSIFPNFTLI